MKKLLLTSAVCALITSATAFAATEAKPSQPTVTNLPVKATISQPVKALTPEQRQLLLPRVAVIYHNNAQTTYDKRIDHFVNEALHEAIDDKNYKFLEGTPFFNECRLAGIADISTAERADLIDILQPYDLDYLVYMEIEPITTRSKATVFSKGKSAVITAPLKIIDMRKNRTLYNGTITEVGKTTVMIGKIGNKSVALEGVKKVNEKMKAVVAERLPKPNF